MCKELKQAFNKESEKFLLTAAVAAGPGSAGTSYEIKEISKQLDFINLMSYDLHGKWEATTGHHTDTNLNAPSSALSVMNCVNFWLKSVTTPSKLILGLASYGRTWKLTDPCNKWEIGSPSPSTGGKAGSATGEGGFLAYYEICKKVWENKVCTSSSSVNAPYGSDGRDFIGYDDPESIVYKVKNIMKAKNLGGFMFWALDLDDFNNQCNTGKYPLMKIAKKAADGYLLLMRSVLTLNVLLHVDLHQLLLLEKRMVARLTKRGPGKVIQPWINGAKIFCNVLVQKQIVQATGVIVIQILRKEQLVLQNQPLL